MRRIFIVFPKKLKDYIQLKTNCPFFDKDLNRAGLTVDSVKKKGLEILPEKDSIQNDILRSWESSFSP